MLVESGDFRQVCRFAGRGYGIVADMQKDRAMGTRADSSAVFWRGIALRVQKNTTGKDKPQGERNRLLQSKKLPKGTPMGVES
jgi:hypothetical protein